MKVILSILILLVLLGKSRGNNIDDNEKSICRIFVEEIAAPVFENDKCILDEQGPNDLGSSLLFAIQAGQSTHAFTYALNLTYVFSYPLFSNSLQNMLIDLPPPPIS